MRHYICNGCGEYWGGTDVCPRCEERAARATGESSAGREASRKDTAYEMSNDMVAECLALARSMDRVKRFPGGVSFLTDLFLAIIEEQGLKVVATPTPPPHG